MTDAIGPNGHLDRRGGEAMSRKDVLVVDDDASIREVIQMALEVVGGWTV